MAGTRLFAWLGARGAIAPDPRALAGGAPKPDSNNSYRDRRRAGGWVPPVIARRILDQIYASEKSNLINGASLIRIS